MLRQAIGFLDYCLISLIHINTDWHGGTVHPVCWARELLHEPKYNLTSLVTASLWMQWPAVPWLHYETETVSRTILSSNQSLVLSNLELNNVSFSFFSHTRSCFAASPLSLFISDSSLTRLTTEIRLLLFNGRLGA